MNRKLLVAVVSGALAMPMAAQVQADEAYTLYGSVRSGIIVEDGSETDAMWDIGAVDGGDLTSDMGGSNDRLWSRIGVKASHELDNGMMAGLQIEKRLDNFRTRHQNVWLGGEMGRIILGQQGSPYHSAVAWDGTNFMGGEHALSGGSRKNGVSFASDLGGPFNFKALVMDNGPKDAFGGDGVDAFELSGSLGAGGVNINVGYADNDTATMMGASVGGSLGGVGWEVGFETKNPDMSGAEDTNRAGLFVDYSIGSGAVYFYYEGLSGAGDGKSWVAGYSHGLGSGVKVIGEHRNKSDNANSMQDGTRSILAVVVGF